jgi:hypothetical protein
MLFASIKFDKFLEVILCGKNGRSTGIRDVYLHHYASLRHGHHYQIENVIFAGQGEIIRNAFAPRLNWWGNVAEREECEQTGREVVTWSKKGHHQIANFKTTPFADLKVRLLPPVNGLPLAIFDDLTLVPSSLADCEEDPCILNSKVILPGAEGYDQHFVDQVCPALTIYVVSFNLTAATTCAFLHLATSSSLRCVHSDSISSRYSGKAFKTKTPSATGSHRSSRQSSNLTSRTREQLKSRRGFYLAREPS